MMKNTKTMEEKNTIQATETDIAFRKVSEPYGWLGNMSKHPVIYNGKEYRTSEALFQWLRLEGYPEFQKVIFEQKSPMGVKMKAKSFKKQIPEEEMKEILSTDRERMKLCLKHKLQSNPELVKMLLETGDRMIIEDCTKRNRGTGPLWGAALIEGEWVGQNMLGELWMEIRSELRHHKKIQ